MYGTIVQAANLMTVVTIASVLDLELLQVSFLASSE
jgi:hypothetical protein